MKNLFLVSIITLLLAACGNQNNTSQEAVAENEKSAVVLSVDELYQKAGELKNQEVVVSGTVMHVCQHGGERCFLMGSNENINIRVEAGESIGAFSQEQMGSDLVVTGILKEVVTEADAHNPDHGEEAEAATEEDAETAHAHKVIADAQAQTETVYFIEGLKVEKKL